MKVKVYECEICKRMVAKGHAGYDRFRSTRKGVRKHLREEHNVKGRKNKEGISKAKFGESRLTASTIAEEFEDE